MKPELEVLPSFQLQIIPFSLRPTLLRAMIAAATLSTPSTTWTSQSDRDWGGYVMDRYVVFYRTFTYQVPITLLISYIFNLYIFHTYLLPFISLKNHFIIEINAL